MKRDRLVLVGVAVMSAMTLLSGCADPDYLRAEAFDSYRAGNYEAARRTFEKTLDLQPGDFKSHYYAGMIALYVYNDPGYARRHLELAYTIRKAKPNNMISEAIETPNEYVPRPTLAQIGDALAEALYRQGNTHQLAGFLREMTTDHGQVEDYLRLGEYMQRIGDPDAAREGYLLAMKMAAPTDARPYTAVAGFYDKVGDKNQALNYLRQAYWIKPGDPEISAAIRDHGGVPGPTFALFPEGLVGRPAAGAPAPATLPAPAGVKPPATQEPAPAADAN